MSLDYYMTDTRLFWESDSLGLTSVSSVLNCRTLHSQRWRRSSSTLSLKIWSHIQESWRGWTGGDSISSGLTFQITRVWQCIDNIYFTPHLTSELIRQSVNLASEALSLYKTFIPLLMLVSECFNRMKQSLSVGLETRGKNPQRHTVLHHTLWVVSFPWLCLLH